MENGVCGIKQNIYEANICLKLNVELHGNLVTLQPCHFLTRKTKKIIILKIWLPRRVTSLSLMFNW